MRKVLPRVLAPVLFLYFLYFAIPALRATFSRDDVGNLGVYWFHGLWGSFRDQIRFGTVYRPMGALFYLPIYDVFGLNPVAYHVAALAIAAANLFFTFRIGELLTKSRAVAALATILVCAHGSMVVLYYDTAMIYDVLAYFFTAAMLYAYLVFRGHGKALTVGQGVVIAILYIAAINSKEIAVVAPAWILAYELLFHRPPKLRVPAILLILAILFAATILFHPHGLAKEPGYRLEFTPHRYLLNNAIYVSSLTYMHFIDSGPKLMAAWAVFTAACAIARRPELWWCWCVACTATIPVSFTVQPRDGGNLYVPLLGFALAASIFAVGLFQRPALQWSVAALAAIMWTWYSVPMWRFAAPGYIQEDRLPSAIIAQFRSLPSRPAPRSRVLILSSPLPDWGTYFIARLVWGDHSVDVKLANMLGGPPDLASYDWILTFEGEDLRVVRTR
jgi:hypothetical protein